jgi:ascorbate-specific PTS system EIIC-type component UlaA
MIIFVTILAIVISRKTPLRGIYMRPRLTVLRDPVTGNLDVTTIKQRLFICMLVRALALGLYSAVLPGGSRLAVVISQCAVQSTDSKINEYNGLFLSSHVVSFFYSHSPSTVSFRT